MAQGKNKWHVGSHQIREEPNDTGGFRLVLERDGFEQRFLEIYDNGPTIRLRAPGNLGADAGLELDETGHVLIHLE